MRELAIVREVARDHRYLAALVVLLGGALVWLYIAPPVNGRSLSGAGHAAIPEVDVRSAAGSAWRWGLVALVPVGLWAGVAAGSPPRPALFMLARPIDRVRMLTARILGVAVPMLLPASLFAFIPATLSASALPLPPLAVAVTAWLAFVAGALGGCAREDEPFALAIGLVLLTVQTAVVIFVFAALGVGVHRPFEALGAAGIPVLAITMFATGWPLVDHWRFVVPRRGRLALRRAGLRWLGSTAILLLLWAAIGAWAGRPVHGRHIALVGLGGDGRVWIATGVRGDPMTESPVDGLVLVGAEAAERDVASWTGAGVLWGLGSRGEVVEMTSSPTGEHVAVVVKSPGRIELYDADGIVASMPVPEGGSPGLDGRWAADGRKFVWLTRRGDTSEAGVFALSSSGVTTRRYDVSSARSPHVLAVCQEVVALADSDAGSGLAFLELAAPGGRIVEVAAPDATHRARFSASPTGCVLARAEPAQDGVRLAMFDAREPSREPTRRSTLPASGIQDVASVVWLDDRHLVLDVRELSGAQTRIVAREDGAIVATHAIRAGRWGLAAAYGPPAGPWIWRLGTTLWATDARGVPLWQATVPALGGEARAAPVAIVGGRVRWFGPLGDEIDIASPWAHEAAP